MLLEDPLTWEFLERINPIKMKKKFYETYKIEETESRKARNFYFNKISRSRQIFG